MASFESASGVVYSSRNGSRAPHALLNQRSPPTGATMTHRLQRSRFDVGVRRAVTLAILLAAAATAPAILRGATPRALPPGKLPDDKRLGPLVDLSGYFPLHPPASRDEWDRRVERVR